MFARLRNALSHRLRHSDHFHIRQSGFATWEEAIGVVDRFLEGGTQYPLEWDDFISWKNGHSGIEKMRNEIGELEPDFFSRDPARIDEATDQVRAIRDRYAVEAGFPARFSGH
jgi:hypothetical protein